VTERLIISVLLAGWLVAFPSFPGLEAGGEKDIAGLLGPIREKHNLPALGGAIVTGNGLQAGGVVGVRKAGTDVAATIEDKWHLGSDTKAMTAALMGMLVEQGRLKWETTVGEAFPELASPISPTFKKISLLALLSHRAGLPADLFWGLIPRSRTMMEQRLAVVEAASKAKLNSEPGTKFLYSNLSYVIAVRSPSELPMSLGRSSSNKLLFLPWG
jgi:CubicO group peptidase (beta-lactamase class C family)